MFKKFMFGKEKIEAFDFSKLNPDLQDFIKGWTPSLGISDLMYKPSGPNWELISAGIEEGKEEKRKEQIEIAKIAYREILEEMNLNKSIPLIHNTTKEEDSVEEIKCLSVKQIALIHIYEQKQITKDNASEIASKYGYTSKTSGEGLYQDYLLFFKRVDRIGEPKNYTPKKMTNKIKLFEDTLKYISDNGKIQAIEEIEIMKKRLEKDI